MFVALRRTKVVLVAGSISDGDGDYDYGTIVELFDMNSNTDCFLDNYPHTADGPTCTFLEEGKIKCCGGEGWEDLDQCYDYEPSSNKWSRAPNLSDTRYWARSAHVEEGFWMVTGGQDCGQDRDCTTTDLWIGTQFIAGPTLEGDDLSAHCQVEIDLIHVFIAEGETGRTWILDWETQKFIEQESMASPKELPGCGKIINFDGEIEVVVASLGESEIFNLSSGTWRQGPDVPVYGSRFGYDQLGDTFVLAGGEDDTGVDLTFLEEVLVFDPIHYQWIIKPHVINPARYGAGVAAVPEEFFTVSCP